MNIEDLPPDVVIAIVRFAKRKSHDTKWKSNIQLTPEMEAIYIKLLYNAFIIGAVKGYDMGINGVDIEE